MPARNDYLCNDCMQTTEYIGKADPEWACKHCGSHNLHVVFCTPVEIRPRPASVVDKVMEVNRKKMDEVYEDDSQEGGEYDRMLREQGSRLA